MMHAIVMGATSGIGYEVAKILASRGWRVGVAGRREDILAKMVADRECAQLWTST